MTRVVTRSMSSLKRFEVCWPRSADSMVPLLPAARAPAVNHNRSAVAPGDVVLGRLLRGVREELAGVVELEDRKSTRLNSSHSQISYAVFCLKKKKKK